MNPHHPTLELRVPSILLCIGIHLGAAAATLYVSPESPEPIPPFTNWATAASNIQDAIDAAAAGDTVVVTNGLYALGGREVVSTTTNRVVVDKAVTVRSVNGPQLTVIEGGNGVRCVYLADGAQLSGFTLANGIPEGEFQGFPPKEKFGGGGIWCESTNACVTNCILTGNRGLFGGGAFSGRLVDCVLTSNGWSNATEGGGAYGSVLQHCTLSNNTAQTGGGASADYSEQFVTRGALYDCILEGNLADRGGAVVGCDLYRCTLIANRASIQGGGAYLSTLNHCSLTGNSAGERGGGASDSTLQYCILQGNMGALYGGGAFASDLDTCLLVGNSAESWGGGTVGGTLFNCTLTANSALGSWDGGGAKGGTLYDCIVYGNYANVNPEISDSLCYGCWTNDPGFVDPNAGDYRLSAASPCIDAGAAGGTYDLDGNPRPLDGDGDGIAAFDIGAYEFLPGTPPNIVRQPLHRTNVVGSSLMMSVTAEGSGALSYQWLKDTEELPGAIGRTHVLANVQLADAGVYQVRVSDLHGSVLSSNATIAIIPAVPPSVLAGPIVNPANGHQYYLLEQSTWVEAEIAAQAIGGHLATIRDSAEQQWLLTNFSLWGGQQRILWIGLHDADPVNNSTNSLERRAEFVWSSGEPVIYHNWSAVEPNNYRERGEYYVHTLPANDSAEPGFWVDAWDVDWNGLPLHGVVEVPQGPTPVTLYVNAASPGPMAPYLTWETAAHTIQDAVDAANAGDTVLVTNGIYDSGGHVVHGTLQNRVAIDRAITVQSVNGPDVTTIVGGSRCVYVGSNAVLSGFTLTGGFTLESGDPIKEQSGGGAWLEPSGLLTNCVLFHNQASSEGGGAYGGTLRDCVIATNQVFSFGGGRGGGISGSTLYDCTLTANRVNSGEGGGAFGASLHDCRLEQNSAFTRGGGAVESTLYRCTVSGNSVIGSEGCQGGGVSSCTLYECLLTDNIVESPWDGYGGGAASSTIYLSTVSGNSVTAVDVAIGGGVFRSTVDDSVLSSNSVSARKSYAYGGGVEGSTLRNCLLFGNEAIGTLYGDIGSEAMGGGATGCTMTNCTVTANSATAMAAIAHSGGVYFSTLQNCIVFDNTASTNSEHRDSTFFHSCTTPLPVGGIGNITNPPAFTNPSAGDYHLSIASPCIDTGANLGSIVTNDLSGTSRPLDGNGDGIAAFDMGAYEFDLLTIVSTNWLLSYGLDPADPYVFGGNPDGDAHTTFQEWLAHTNPTNALSCFRIEAISAGPPLTVSFLSCSNRLYTLCYATNLSFPIWNEVAGQCRVSGSGGLDTLTNVAAEAQGLYRVRVDLNPDAPAE